MKAVINPPDMFDSTKIIVPRIATNAEANTAQVRFSLSKAESSIESNSCSLDSSYFSVVTTLLSTVAPNLQ